MGQLKVMNCQMPTKRGDFHNPIVDEDDDEQTQDVDEDAEEFFAAKEGQLLMIPD